MVNAKYGSCSGSDKIAPSLKERMADYSESELSREQAVLAVLLDVSKMTEEDRAQLESWGVGEIDAPNAGLAHARFIVPLVAAQRFAEKDYVIGVDLSADQSPIKQKWLFEDELDAIQADEPTSVLPNLDDENWYDKLEKHEIVEVDGNPCPKLVGLRRLAKPYIQREWSQVNDITIVQKEVRRPLNKWKVVHDDENGKQYKVLIGVEEMIGTDFYPYASVTFTVELKDGREFTDSADAYLGNCSELGNYPTAVASARAEGRVLRKVLGIQEHVYEELSSKDALQELTSAEDSPIAAEQKKMIETTLRKLDGISLRDVLEHVSKEATNLDELTSAQAITAIKYLNEKKKSKKK